MLISTKWGAVTAASATISQRRALDASGVVVILGLNSHHSPTPSDQVTISVAKSPAETGAGCGVAESATLLLAKARQTRQMCVGAW